MKPSLASCWYPFRSPEVTAIYEHLTPDEASRLKQYSWKAGGLFGIFIQLLIFPVVFLVFQFTPQPWGFLAIFTIAIPLGLAIGIVGGAPIRNTAKKILCDSAYAREKGFTPNNLRLYSFSK